MTVKGRNSECNKQGYIAFRLAETFGIDPNRVDDELYRAMELNNYVTTDGENQTRATINSARTNAENDGPFPPRPGGGYDYGNTTLTDGNGEPIVDKLSEVDADGQPTEAAEAAQDQWKNAVRQRAMEMRLTDEAKRVHAAWKVQQAGLTPCPGVDLEEYLAVPDEDAQYRITDLLPTGGRALLAAQQKAGKTSLLGALIKSLADGTPFLGRFPVQQVERVALFDTELDARMLRRWLRRNGVKNRNRVKVHTLRGKLSTFDFRDETLRRHWLDELRGSDFVILDCLRPVLDTFGLSEDKDAGKFLVAWDEFLADAGVGESVVAHHMGHTGERARGDSRLQDWPDVNWRIVKESQTVKDGDQSVGMDRPPLLLRPRSRCRRGRDGAGFRQRRTDAHGGHQAHRQGRRRHRAANRDSRPPRHRRRAEPERADSAAAVAGRPAAHRPQGHHEGRQGRHRVTEGRPEPVAAAHPQPVLDGVVNTPSGVSKNLTPPA